MPRRNFKWTPEAVEHLRRWDGIVSDFRIASQLECSYWAVVAKKRELKFLANRVQKLPLAQQYARLYSVSKATVEFFGVEALAAMDEETRRHTLWSAGKRFAQPGTAETTEHIERMMALAGKVA